ncbi:nicotinate-nucleotide pyrophosphorylase [Leptolyngbya boryana NIES-2135]|uniref:Probable nicotinate-nucleotide pyrophosphorylase [carboxylating] n=1 Tax=Leptolyngbya boryana NIES-2135 TaxID=1973484 RepID=A0A1Z4JJA5_LEPBY|nr:MULTISPECIES: carboxylating nicotinate-nucleotide diphosphorylase [Leptolyngbya]BAY56743.1 nicotinate-nucleotide pyrophosphorylase [Leptolyngbya boryana NIES-2135]MBD2369420.1 carboxylating nicotinate-nucleotide diphosphorylase [Leptolyngbya sp. FACHB-161]MBD2376835.1 carboxylating nicotinate-nucleotide diphosphorylase [Leptolyngbya sp. FACHB-238]MBD2401202.1 carboxylating nicotinate-nucleotide diphosphorylase [Leptolyngbya sp. FACHB-239]MBD2407753.1 carboxylating nicotinate-nucleotide diph
MNRTATLPSQFILDKLLQEWLLEDIGRGDRTTQSLISGTRQAVWIAKENGVIAGLPIAERVFQLLNASTVFTPIVQEGEAVQKGQTIAEIQGAYDALLTGERVALNLAMRLSGIATLTRRYVEKIEDLPTRLTDTRKTTPGLRVLEKYATRVGGAVNHRMGLDDAAMIKDNHIVAAGGIGAAIAQVRANIPYPLTIEVETETLDMVEQALEHGADIIMLDNMPLEMMRQAVEMIRRKNDRIRVEASGNVTLETLRSIAETGVDFISSSAPITRSTWLDLSMRFKA